MWQILKYESLKWVDAGPAQPGWISAETSQWIIENNKWLMQLLLWVEAVNKHFEKLNKAGKIQKGI